MSLVDKGADRARDMGDEPEDGLRATVIALLQSVRPVRDPSHPLTLFMTVSAPSDRVPDTAQPCQARLGLVDKLRGLMIVLMVLDHVRECFHIDALLFQPTDIDQTTPLLFATRWVTHLCAPTFVLLSGVAIGLQQQAGKTGWPLSRFLLTRGAWLILLELTVVGLALDFAWPFVFLQVIWAIGAGMILMAALVHLPKSVVLAIGLVILAGHQAAAMLVPADKGAFQLAWTLLIEPGPIPPVLGFVAYPALPWFAIMAIGFGLTGLFTLAPKRRDRRLVMLGLGALALFAVLRLINLYGDPRPWTLEPEAARTILSFLDVSKYPPSLAFGLATVGVSLALAPLVGRVGGPAGRLLDVMGRTPLFTYLIHLPLIHAAAMLVGFALGYPPGLFIGFLSDSSRLVEAGWGVDLARVYVIWALVVLALWPVSAAFARIKAKGTRPWLSYL